MSSQELYEHYLRYYDYYCQVWDLAANYLSPCIDASLGVEKLEMYFTIDDISADDKKLINDRNTLINYSNQIWNTVIPGMEAELDRMFKEVEQQQARGCE